MTQKNKDIETYVDNSAINEVLEILESLADEELAVELLREFNNKHKALGQLVVNLDESLSNDEWQKKCDTAKTELDEIIKKIKSL